MRVIQYGEPVLREVGQPVVEFDGGLARLAEDMVETMHAEDGIGLAAQQVGEPLQLFVMDVRPPAGSEASFDWRFDSKQPPLDLIMPLVVVNPKIRILDPNESDYEEGCLSFPEVRGRVRRPVGLRCAFQDVSGNAHTIEGDGLLARCILHEVDHLNGELFIDKMNRRDLQKAESRIKQIKRASRDMLKAKS